MLKYVTLALIMGSVFMGWTWAALAVASIAVVTASVFYLLCFNLIAGLKESSLTDDFSVAELGSLRVVQLATLAFMWMTGFHIAAVFILPWVAIMTLTDVMSLSVRWGWVEIEPSDSDE